MDKLIIEDDAGGTTVLPLFRDELTVGRKEGNTIRLTEQNVSRRHARLVRLNGAVFVEDVGSSNGVRLNGQLIKGRTPIAEGDRVAIGDYKLVVKYEQPPIIAGGPVPQATTIGSTQPLRAAAPDEAARPRPHLEAATPEFPVPAVTITPAPSPPSTIAPPPAASVPSAPVSTPAPVATPAPVSEPEVRTAPPARLVALSTELAGTEYALDLPSMVVGRTEDADVVVKHGSISRHHAKIVREGDRYVITDLQSANGVRVNGGDWERIELHPGDIVELGNVRLRFVGGNEQYVFDASAVRSRGRVPLKPLLIGLGVVAVTAVVVMLFKTPTKGVSRIIEPVPQATVAVVPTAPTPAPNPAPNPPAPAPEPNPQIDPEAKNAAFFADLQKNAKAKSWDDAVAAFVQISDDSIYRDRAKVIYKDVRAKFVAQHLEAGGKLISQGQCDEVRHQADLVLAVDETNTRAPEMVERCARTVAERAAPKAKEPPPKPEKPAAQAPVAEKQTAPRRTGGGKATASAPEPIARPVAAPAPQPPAPPEVKAPPKSDVPGDPAALMTQARAAWVKGQHAAAIDLAKDALKAKPGMAEAYKLIAISSCALGDNDGAGRAYAKLDENSKKGVKTLCSRSGITLE